MIRNFGVYHVEYQPNTVVAAASFRETKAWPFSWRKKGWIEWQSSKKKLFWKSRWTSSRNNVDIGMELFTMCSKHSNGKYKNMYVLVTHFPMHTLFFTHNNNNDYDDGVSLPTSWWLQDIGVKWWSVVLSVQNVPRHGLHDWSFSSFTWHLLPLSDLFRLPKFPLPLSSSSSLQTPPQFSLN